MAAASRPYGLRPVNLLGGQGFAGSTRQYAIPSGYAEDILYGDPVIITASGSTRGTLARFTATQAQGTITSAATLVGVFLGVQYTDPTYGLTFRQYWPTGTVASDAVAFVCDDPDALFAVQADGSLAQTALGTNAAIIQTAVGNTATGNSGVGLDASSIADTATLPLRIVDFSRDPGDAIGDAFTNVIVRINTHFHRTTTGVANA